MANWEGKERKTYAMEKRMTNLPVVVLHSSCQGAWRFQEKRGLTKANLQVEVFHVDLGVHVGVVGLPLTQGGEVAHQEVQRDQGVLGVWLDLLYWNQGTQLLHLSLGRFDSQSQGVGRCIHL